VSNYKAQWPVRLPLAKKTSRDVVDKKSLLALASMDDLDLYERRLDIRLKETYASNAIKAVGVQLAIADGVFIFYAVKHGIGSVPGPVMETWLGATVVQVVGVVLVITRSLFPARTETIKTEHKG